MPYYKTSQEWLDQSALLLEARPSTTRITTKYSIKPTRTRAAKPTTTTPSTPAAAPRAALVLKTYDPVSGVTLKYRTTKAAEVSRLVYASLGRLGRGMAAVPEPPAEEEMPDAGAVESGDGAGKEQKGGAAAAAAAQVSQQGSGQQQGGGGGGGKKKKKGKK